MNNDTVKITFVDGTHRVISNTNYNNLRDCVLRDENFVVNSHNGKLSVTYVTSNILTIEVETK